MYFTVEKQDKRSFREMTHVTVFFCRNIYVEKLCHFFSEIDETVILQNECLKQSFCKWLKILAILQITHFAIWIENIYMFVSEFNTQENERLTSNGYSLD